VDFDCESRSGPGGATQRQRELFSFGRRNPESRRITFRKSCLHRQAHTGRLPVNRRRSIEVHPQLVAGFVINSVSMKAVTLDATADTTGEAAHHVLVLMLDALTHRHHVTGASVFGID